MQRPVLTSAILNLKYLLFLIISVACLNSGCCLAQAPVNASLEKMPADLEQDFALSALPPQLRPGAAVYLLDPGKGYYLARKGSNGFTCFVARTEWEYALFSPDVATAISFDAVGTRTIFRIYLDVAAMRASGRYSAATVKDSMIARIKRGYYEVPTPGISYMLSPVMRNYPGDIGTKEVKTMSGPHYMFYAPYLTNADIGNIPGAPARGPVIVNQGDNIFGTKKGGYGFIILPAGIMEKAAIINENKNLLTRLVAYKDYFKIDTMGMHH
jgi:hypothetical protein